MVSRGSQAALLLAALLLAGCAAPLVPGDVEAMGSKPIVFTRYDYTARVAERSAGSIAVRVDTDANRGLVAATFLHAERAWEIQFSDFTGGPAGDPLLANVTMLGASGLGERELPAVHALHAGWGTATAWVDGTPFVDPATGSPSLAARYVATDTAPYEPATGRVFRSQGLGYFDPRHPENGLVRPGQVQVLLDLASIGPPRAVDSVVAVQDRIAGAQAAYEQRSPFEVGPGALVAYVNISVTNPREVQILAKLSFTVRDPAGRAVAGSDFEPVLKGQEGRWFARLVVPGPMEPGLYALETRGAGVDVDYAATMAVDYPEPVTLHVVYTEARSGP